MNRILLLVILLAAVGAGVWLLMQEGGAPVAADPASAAGVAAPQPEAGRLSAPETVPDPAASGLSRSEATTAAAAADPQAPVYATPAAANEGFLVRVVRKEGGEPIPFADVFFVDVANLDQQKMAAAQAETRGLLEMIEFLAARYRAGADGSVRLPLPGDQVWIAARSDRWFGTFDGRTIPLDGVTIECAQMRAVSARVVDGDGRPQADVPVQLRVLDDGHDQTIITVRTDAQGIALIQPLDMLARRGEGSDASFALALGGILADPVRAEFDVSNPPAEPLTLVLPPHGLLEVRITAQDGKPWTEPAFVQALPAAVEPDPFGEMMMEGEGLSGVPRDGMLLLRPVGLGQPLIVRAKRPDGTTIGEARCAGPARPGETLRVEILEQSGASVVTGRAIRADGTPLAGARLQYEIANDSLNSSSSAAGQINTGDDGGFRLQIEDPQRADEGSRVLKLRVGGAAGSAEQAEADLSWNLPPGVTDLGNLVFTLPPLLVSGTVVDEAGAPLAGVFVQARPQVFYGKDQFYWNWNNDLQARSGADGSFSIHGRVDSALIRVSGSNETHWCAGTDVAPGSSGVLVVMSAAGRMAGKLLLDAGASAEGFSLQLVSEQEGDRETTHWGVRIEADGGFQFVTLPPGRYRLELSLQGSSTPLTTLDGLLVLAGEGCSDPRLNPFDARGKVRLMRVSAVDERGRPLRHFQVIEQLADGSREHFWANEDEILVPLRDTPSDLLVQYEGCLTVRLEDAAADCMAQMLPGPRIRLTLSGAGSLPDGHRLVVGLKSAAGAVEDFSGPSQDVDAHGVADFNAPLTGLCAITLVMYGTKDGITHGAWVEIENAEIDVRAAAGTQSFTVNVDPAKLQTAIDQIASRLQ